MTLTNIRVPILLTATTIRNILYIFSPVLPLTVPENQLTILRSTEIDNIATVLVTAFYTATKTDSTRCTIRISPLGTTITMTIPISIHVTLSALSWFTSLEENVLHESKSTTETTTTLLQSAITSTLVCISTTS